MRKPRLHVSDREVAVVHYQRGELPHRPHRIAVLIRRPILSRLVGLDDLNPVRLSYGSSSS